jgi:hypothetical protein
VIVVRLSERICSAICITRLDRALGGGRRCAVCLIFGWLYKITFALMKFLSLTGILLGRVLVFVFHAYIYESFQRSVIVICIYFKMFDFKASFIRLSFTFAFRRISSLVFSTVL